MPTKGGLDEFNRKMEYLRLLLKNYNKAIVFIASLTAPCEKYTPIINEILETDKRVREGLGIENQ
jgi:hypothetical protein